MQTAATLACVLLSALGLLQLALVGGAPLGRLAWGGQHAVLPRHLRIGSLFAITIYLAIALVLLARAGLVDWGPPWLVRTGTWAVVVYGVLGVVLNAVSRSPAERLTMTPAALLLLALALVLAIG
jgi:hypothetical protein